MKEETKGLGEFFDEFIERHRISNGRGFELVVTEEECARLGEFFIRGMLGWASGYDLASQSQPRESPPADAAAVEGNPEEIAEAGESNGSGSFVR
jgi:hypothetical protein